MLKTMRSKSNRIFFLILLGMLVAGLAGFGIRNFTGGSVRSIGSVGDEKITVNTYAQQLDQAIQNISRRIGRNVTADEIRNSGLQRAVLSQVIATAGLNNEANRLGLSVGDESVRQALIATPSFQSLDGKFDPEAYKYALERANMKAADYEETLREQDARGLIQGAVTDGVATDDTVAKAFVAFGAETRDFDWVKLTADNLTDPVPEPTDAQIDEQYKANPDTYTSPLTKQITYAWLKPESLTGDVAISDADLKEAYQINSEKYDRPARRAVDRIVFSDLAEAKAARARLDAGTIDFDKLAEERGLAPEDIDQGEVEKNQLPKAAGDLIFGAKDPGIVGPVDSELGPALYRINAIFDEQITSFEDAKPELRAELAAEKTDKMVLQMVPDIEDKLAAGATLEDLAKETKMELGTISYTSDTTDGIAAYEEFRTVADTTSEGDFPEVQNLSDGGIFALRVDKVTQPALIPLDQVRDRVIADWKASETKRRLLALAGEDAQKLAETSSFNSLGLTPTTATGQLRTGHIDGTPPTMLTQVFGAKDGGTVVVEDTDAVYLAKVTKVHPADLTSANNIATIGRIRSQLDQQISSDILDAYTTAIQDKAGVTLESNALEAVNRQLLSRGLGG